MHWGPGTLCVQARTLVHAGGLQLVQQADRWGRSALDEARRLGLQPLVELMEGAEPACVRGHEISSQGSSGSASSPSQGSHISGLHGSGGDGSGGSSARGSSPLC